TLADAQEATQQARAIYDGVVADLRAHGLELGPAES
ncbi:MAG: hypothetical protein HW416_271, partial [Chloroflexi bacterium]|nr:hypothetical protein [Chloroflexota bacterium]